MIIPIIGTAAAIAAIILLGYFIYDRHIRSKHQIDIEPGRIAVLRIASPNENRNEKQALLFYTIDFVNSGPSTVTLKEVQLRYRLKGQWRWRESTLISIPTGEIEGKSAVALANSEDTIVIGSWINLREVLNRRQSLNQGEVITASAVFMLESPKAEFRQMSSVKIIIRDYLGGKSSHEFKPESNWFKGNDKGFSLVDAPVCKKKGRIQWEGVKITKNKPS